MFGVASTGRRPRRERAERPFWISYSDLMTALMILFLVVMAAALLSVTREVRHQQSQERDRTAKIQYCMSEVGEYARTIPGITLRDQTVLFGSLAQFDNNSSVLTAAQGEFLRRFIPKVLKIARTPACTAFLKQITVAGFASPWGTYIYNLDLSERRSERVLCALLDPAIGTPLSEADRRLVQELFFVGGYSSNSSRASDEDSRRIELKLEFYALKERRSTVVENRRNMILPPAPVQSNCPIGNR